MDKLRIGSWIVVLCLAAAAEVVRAQEKPPLGWTLTSKAAAGEPKVAELKVGERILTGASATRHVRLGAGGDLFVNEKSQVELTEKNVLKLQAGEIYVDLKPRADDFIIKTPQRTVRGQGGSWLVRVDTKGTSVVALRGAAMVSDLAEPLRAGWQSGAAEAKPWQAPRATHEAAWLKDLLIAAHSPLVPGSQYAGGALQALRPNGEEAKITLRRFHIDVHIEDGFARTTIDQTYFNHDSGQLEGTFYFPLPPDASLSRLAMYVDGQLMEGGMAEREHARNVYETIRYANRDPALLEWLDGSTFKMRVFPLAPRSEKRIILSYTQKLPGLYGRGEYRFPAGHSLQKVDKWSFHGRVKHGAAASWHSPSHALKASKDGGDLLLDAEQAKARTDRDVVLQLQDDGAGIKPPADARFFTAVHDGSQYLMVRYRPELKFREPADENRRRLWVFLFEASADRSPLLGRAQIDVIRHGLAHINPDDQFIVATAGTRVRFLSETPWQATDKNIQTAVEFLERAHLVGALDLENAFKEIGKILPAQRPETFLVHVGSGTPALGQRRLDELVQSLPGRGLEDGPPDPKTQASRKRVVSEAPRYVGVGVGRRWNRAFMKAAAERTAGHFTQINPDEPIAWRAFDLVATLATPRLHDIQVLTEADAVPLSLLTTGLRTPFHVFAQTAADGEEICAITRLGPGPGDGAKKEAGKIEMPAHIIIRGQLEGKAVEYKLKVGDARPGADYMPRTWAKLEIDRLLAEGALKNKDAIIALSKAMYVMTPFTSLLVLEHEDLYLQYKVDRGRKDHWALYPAPDKIPVVGDGPQAKEAKGLFPVEKVLESVVVRAQPKVLNLGIMTEVERLAKRERTKPADLVTESSLPLGFARKFGSEFPVADLFMPLRSASFDFADLRSVSDSGGWNRAFLRALPTGGVVNTNFTADYGNLNETYFLDQLAPPKGNNPEVIRILALNPAGEAWSKAMPDPASFLRGESQEDLKRFARLSKLRTAKVINEEEFDSNHLFGRPQREEETNALRNLAGGDVARPGNLSRIDWLYRRPGFSGEDAPFFNLLAYATGMSTSAADVLAVLEAEALPTSTGKIGRIDDSARELIDKARRVGWRTWTPQSDLKTPPTVSVTFDGAGRFVIERTLPLGIRERMICDGKTLLHLYPQLHVGARRDVSRFHRGDFSAMLPRLVAPAEDLAQGADLKLVGPRTVALVPHGEEQWRALIDQEKAWAKKSEEKSTKITWQRLHLVFSNDGELAQRQIIAMPANTIALRQIFERDGRVRLVDGDDKEISVERGQISAAAAPDLTPELAKLVVLPLPYRSAEHAIKAQKLQKTQPADMRLSQALPLLAAHVGAGKGEEALAVYRQVFREREQRQLGYYVLLASAGVNLDSQHADVLAEHLDEPLAQYLALHTSPVLRKHASQWAVQSGGWGDGFLQHLAATHALFQRWQNDKIAKIEPARFLAERQRALDYVAKNKGTQFAWALLCLVQDRVDAKDKDAQRDLAAAFAMFEDHAALGYFARYERARCLHRAGQAAAAQQRFRELYQARLKEGALPAIDAEFRTCLLNGDKDAWGPLLSATADALVKDKNRPALLALAAQCQQLEDRTLANMLIGRMLKGVQDTKEKTGLTWAALNYYWDSDQIAQADEVLEQLTGAEDLANKPALWRKAAQMADHRNMHARALECLEKAVDLEFRQLPERLQLNTVRGDYSNLLDHYQKLADAMIELKIKPAPDFAARVVGAADRWRALDPDADQSSKATPSEKAAWILHRLGQKELSWDYLTTTVAHQPAEAEAWLRLARNLARYADPLLADRAYRAAFDAEPTNPQILWDRAENLRRAGRPQEARELIRQIATGGWQPRFQGLVSQANQQVE